MNPLMARELEIVDKSSIPEDDDQVDFSCQFSYHTIASTKQDDNLDAPPESEEDEEETESEQETSETPPEYLSTHPEQLSSSEQEKMSIVYPPPAPKNVVPVYNVEIPDFADVMARINKRNQKRSQSLTDNIKLRDIQRRLILVNRPFMPKYVKHKKYRSENASEVSAEMNEENYYKKDENIDEEEDEFPEYDIDDSMPYNNIKPKENSRPANILLQPSPSLRDCDVTRPIKKPTIQDKINRIKDPSYNPDSTRKTSILSKASQDSFPVRLNTSNPSEGTEDHKSQEDFVTPEEVEQLYRDLFKNMKPENIPPLTSFSQKSKPTLLDSKRDARKDWADTPLYEEYVRRGKRVYPKINENKYYIEEEIDRVYYFVKNRYSKKENDKSVTNFYKKAMDTMFLLTDEQMNFDSYRKIRQMYSNIDVTNTLKLLMR